MTLQVGLESPGALEEVVMGSQRPNSKFWRENSNFEELAGKFKFEGLAGSFEFLNMKRLHDDEGNNVAIKKVDLNIS